MRRKRPLIKPNSIRSVKHFFEKSLRKNFENLKNGTLGSREARCESEERLWTSRSDLTRSFFKKVKRTKQRKFENTAKIKNKKQYVMKNYLQKKINTPQPDARRNRLFMVKTMPERVKIRRRSRRRPSSSTFRHGEES